MDVILQDSVVTLDYQAGQFLMDGKPAPKEAINAAIKECPGFVQLLKEMQSRAMADKPKITAPTTATVISAKPANNNNKRDFWMVLRLGETFYEEKFQAASRLEADKIAAKRAIELKKGEYKNATSVVVYESERDKAAIEKKRVYYYKKQPSHLPPEKTVLMMGKKRLM